MVRIRLERGRHAAEYFTIPGRILVLTAIVLAVGGPWVVVAWLNESLPPGSYPLWFFALPIWVGTALLFILVAGVFKWLKVPIFRQPPHPGDLGGDESKPYAADGADTRPD